MAAINRRSFFRFLASAPIAAPAAVALLAEREIPRFGGVISRSMIPKFARGGAFTVGSAGGFDLKLMVRTATDENIAAGRLDRAHAEIVARSFREMAALPRLDGEGT